MAARVARMTATCASALGTRKLASSFPLGERHLRLAVSEFVEHYHLERNHQGLDNRLLTTPTTPANENAVPAAPIACRERLGGLLKHYFRSAA